MSFDEKLFCTELCFNAKNYVAYSTTFEGIPENLRTVKRFQNKNSVMIWGEVSNNGKLPLKFIDKGVKINAEFYKQGILATHLLLKVDRLYPKKTGYFNKNLPLHTEQSQHRTHFMSIVPNLSCNKIGHLYHRLLIHQIIASEVI